MYLPLKFVDWVSKIRKSNVDLILKLGHLKISVYNKCRYYNQK